MPEHPDRLKIEALSFWHFPGDGESVIHGTDVWVHGSPGRCAVQIHHAFPQSLTGLPSWLWAVVRLGQGIGVSVTVQYSEAEDAWYASMAGPARGEQWEVKHGPTAEYVCQALLQKVGNSLLPNGTSYRIAYADYFVEDVPNAPDA